MRRAILDIILHVVAYDSDEMHLVSAPALAGLSATSKTAPLVGIAAPMVWHDGFLHVASLLALFSLQ